MVESKRDTGAVTVVRVVEQPPLQTNLNKYYNDTPASGKGACMGLPGVWHGVAAPSISRHSVQCVASRVLHQLTSEKCMFWKIVRSLLGIRRTTDMLDILRPRFSTAAPICFTDLCALGYRTEVYAGVLHG